MDPIQSDLDHFRKIKVVLDPHCDVWDRLTKLIMYGLKLSNYIKY